PTGPTPTSRTTCPTTGCWSTTSHRSRRPPSCSRSSSWTTLAASTGQTEHRRRSTMALDKPYKDIPGTTIYDAEQARKGYHLNQFSMSLVKPANRERYLADREAYLDEWPLNAAQRQAVLDMDLNAMIAEGGNIYFLSKIGAT